MTRSSDARAKAAITYKVVAESNGHKWMEWAGMIYFMLIRFPHTNAESH